MVCAQREGRFWGSRDGLFKVVCRCTGPNWERDKSKTGRIAKVVSPEGQESVRQMGEVRKRG